MKTTVKHFLLLTLMLVGFSGVSWAQEPVTPAPTGCAFSQDTVMPAGSRNVIVVWKADPNLHWVMGNPLDTIDTVGLTFGFENLLFAKLDTATADTAFLKAKKAALAANADTVGFAFRYVSLDTTVARFADSSDFTSLQGLKKGTCQVLAIYDGNDDFYADSALLTLIITEPDTLTVVRTSVGGSLAVEMSTTATWSNATWAGWTTQENTHTVGDVTITGPAYEGEGHYLYVNNNQSLTFNVPSGTITRIAMVLEADNNSATNQWPLHEEFDAFNGTPTNSVTFDNLNMSISKIVVTVSGSDSINATSVDSIYLVIPGTHVVIQATPDTLNHYHLASWSTGDSLNAYNTDTVLVVSDTTVSALFEKNSPMLAWTYGGELMDSVLSDSTVTAYLGFTADTLAKVNRIASEEFISVYGDTALAPLTVRYGSLHGLATYDTLHGLVVNGHGRDTVYMVYSDTVFAYDSVVFYLEILAPDTLILAQTPGGVIAIDSVFDTISTLSETVDGAFLSNEDHWRIAGTTLWKVDGASEIFNTSVFNIQENGTILTPLANVSYPLPEGKVWRAVKDSNEVQENQWEYLTVLYIDSLYAGLPYGVTKVAQDTFVVVPGTQMVISAVANTHYYLSAWTPERETVTDSIHLTVDGDTVVSATFTPFPKLTVVCDSIMGSVTVIKVPASEGYIPNRVDVLNVNVAGVDSVMGNDFYAKAAVDGNITVVQDFENGAYIMYYFENGDSGNQYLRIKGDYTIDSLEVTNNPSYTSSDAFEYLLANNVAPEVNGNVALYRGINANFVDLKSYYNVEQATITISQIKVFYQVPLATVDNSVREVLTPDSVGGNVYTLEPNTRVLLKAAATADYDFVMWNDSSVVDSTYLVLAADTTVTANFGIKHVRLDSINIHWTVLVDSVAMPVIPYVTENPTAADTMGYIVLPILSDVIITPVPDSQAVNVNKLMVVVPSAQQGQQQQQQQLQSKTIGEVTIYYMEGDTWGVALGREQNNNCGAVVNGNKISNGASDLVVPSPLFTVVSPDHEISATVDYEWAQGN